MYITTSDSIIGIEILTEEEILAGFGGTIHASALFDSGSWINITREASWATNNDYILEVIESFIGSSNVGSVMVTVTYAGISESKRLEITEQVNYINNIPFP